MNRDSVELVNAFQESGAPASMLGSAAWGRRGGGALTRRERAAIARGAVLAQLARLPRALRIGLGSGDTANAQVLRLGEPPDSALATKAHQLAGEHEPRALLLHSLRCWYWGDLLGRLRGVAHDSELLFVACALHDIGLSDAHRPQPEGACSCFAIAGAELAGESVRAWGADDAYAVRVADAIALHFNPTVALGVGAEAHLLHAAAQLDVAGIGTVEVPRAAREAVLERCPREGFVSAFAQAMQREAIERPGSRAAFMWRLALPRLLKANPLDS